MKDINIAVSIKRKYRLQDEAIVDLPITEYPSI